MKSINWHAVTGVCTGLLALATGIAVVFALWQTLDAAHARTAQNYLELRKTFLKVDADLDKVNRGLVYRELDGCPQWHMLKRYWYFSETEWKVAQIDQAQRDNWYKTQLPQVANALRRPAYRGAFLEMRDSPAGRWNDEDGQTFVKAIQGQYEKIRQAAQKKGDESVKPLEDTSDFKIAPPCSAATPVADGIHWYRDSAEMKAIYQQTYSAASAAAKNASRRYKPGTWGVILDIDETVLDNSIYQKELASRGAAYSDGTFLEWLQKQEALLLPGAADFILNINRNLHGRIVLVTNQNPAQCAQTVRRLKNLQMPVERVLCDDAGTQDKNARFELAQKGDSSQHIPPLTVVLWIGDNIRDFPALTQASPSDFSAFGTRYFALPNPMYGSWQKVPPR